MQLRRTVLPVLATAAMLAALASPASAATHGKLKDSDRDGMPDRWELTHHLNPRNAKDAKQDLDHDGLTDLREFQLGGNPRTADTDGDGVLDGFEAKHGLKLSSKDSNGDGVSDGDSDADHDGICDRDQKSAVGVVDGYDSDTGTLTVTTKAGATKTYTLDEDTEIDQREHKGWRHVPGGDPSTGQPPVDDDPGADDNSGSGDDVVFGDGDDDDPMADNNNAANAGDPGDGDFSSTDDQTGDPTDGATAIEPDGYDLLTDGAVVLDVKVAKDGTVEQIRLA